MEKVTIRDRMLMCAESGETRIKLNLYKKQVRTLIDEGYTVQKIGPVANYPEQSAYKIDWKDAVEGSAAYELLLKAAEVKPELLPQDDESDSLVPPSYSTGGGWAEI